MPRSKFSLNSEQLELLLAFEESAGLAQLAEKMAKDPSVISRNIQRIAEAFPVLQKVKGKWELTALGVQANEVTRSSIKKYEELLSHKTAKKVHSKLCGSEKSVLMIINAQNGLLDATQAGRNNTEAEKNILKLLEHWRKNKRQVVHIKHVSEKPGSIYFRGSTGIEILKPLTPVSHEFVFEKTKSSAFEDTVLVEKLEALDATELVLTGFTANECIDATARDASAFGFKTLVVGDATAMFDVLDASGKLLKADRIHRLTLANINAFYAQVIRTSEVIEDGFSNQ